MNSSAVSVNSTAENTRFGSLISWPQNRTTQKSVPSSISTRTSARLLMSESSVRIPLARRAHPDALFVGSSQRSVHFWSVSMANKSSIVSDLHGWRTPSVSGEELQAPGKSGHSRRRNREGPASSKGLNSQRGFGPAVEPRRKSRPRSTSLHGSSPCKCQRLSTLRWDRLPPSRPSTKSGARAGGRRLSDRRLHRWLAGTSASAPSSHGAADLLGLNRAHICVRNQFVLRRN